MSEPSAEQKFVFDFRVVDRDIPADGFVSSPRAEFRGDGGLGLVGQRGGDRLAERRRFIAAGNIAVNLHALTVPTETDLGRNVGELVVVFRHRAEHLLAFASVVGGVRSRHQVEAGTDRELIFEEAFEVFGGLIGFGN